MNAHFKLVLCVVALFVLFDTSFGADDSEKFDVIVVGLGPAGSTLAGRLSEHRGVSVLALEAGFASQASLGGSDALDPQVQDVDKWSSGMLSEEEVQSFLEKHHPNVAKSISKQRELKEMQKVASELLESDSDDLHLTVLNDQPYLEYLCLKENKVRAKIHEKLNLTMYDVPLEWAFAAFSPNLTHRRWLIPGSNLAKAWYVPSLVPFLRSFVSFPLVLTTNSAFCLD